MSAVTQPEGRARLRLAALLGMLAMLGSLSIDMYLPALPDIAEDLGSSASHAQLSLTSCLVGLGLGQFVLGPVSDSFGRRKPLLVSLASFTVASLLCALAPNTTTLVLARFVQGLTASGGVVLSRAIVRDVFSGKALATFYSLLMAIIAVGPLVAPIAGGGILTLPSSSWRTVFFVLSLLGLFIVVVVGARLGETLPAERRAADSFPHAVRAVCALLTDRAFIGYALVIALIHGGSFAYVAGTPFVYQDLYGVSPQTFSVLFGVNGLAFISGSLIVARSSGVVRVRRLIGAALVVALTASLTILVNTIVEGPLAAVVIPMFVFLAAMGVILTASFPMAMEHQRHRAGSASAVLGTLPLLLGAAVAPLVGLDESTGVPMGVALFVSCSMGAAAFFGLTGQEGPRWWSRPPPAL